MDASEYVSPSRAFARLDEEWRRLQHILDALPLATEVRNDIRLFDDEMQHMAKATEYKPFR